MEKEWEGRVNQAEERGGGREKELERRERRGGDELRGREGGEGMEG